MIIIIHKKCTYREFARGTRKKSWHPSESLPVSKSVLAKFNCHKIEIDTYCLFFACSTMSAREIPIRSFLWGNADVDGRYCVSRMFNHYLFWPYLYIINVVCALYMEVDNIENCACKDNDWYQYTNAVNVIRYTAQHAPLYGLHSTNGIMNNCAKKSDNGNGIARYIRFQYSLYA